LDFEKDEIAKSENPIFRNLGEKLIDTESVNLEDFQILTDNFSPVEYLTAEVYQNAN
jgi:hypothetical protein